MFRFLGDRLLFEDFHTSRLLTSPNDLVVTTGGETYVTNLWDSNVVLFDRNQSWRVVAEDICFANGIALAPPLRLLVSSGRGQLLAFDRCTDGSLRHRRVLATGVRCRRQPERGRQRDLPVSVASLAVPLPHLRCDAFTHTRVARTRVDRKEDSPRQRRRRLRRSECRLQRGSSGKQPLPRASVRRRHLGNVHR